MPDQHGSHGPGCDPAPREGDPRKILVEEAILLHLFLLLFQLLVGPAAAWMPKASQSCVVVWLHSIPLEVN